MAELSLFDLGWRQGSVLRARLSLPSATLQRQWKSVAIRWGSAVSRRNGLGDDIARIRLVKHDAWAVASQDCDLSSCTASDDEECLELRPLYTDGVPPDFGIRSRKLRLTDELYAHADSPRLNVSPMLLNALAKFRDPALPDNSRILAFKKWLGLRYDRPAVPPEHGDLMKAIAEAVSRKEPEVQGKLHDILVQLSDEQPPLYQVFAVIVSESDEQRIREWLATRLADIPSELGVLEMIDAGTKAQVSLELIETSYAADLSKLTWGKKGGPRGAY